MNQYVHHVPGRLRVRVSGIKGDLAGASSLEKLIRAQGGVTNVQTSLLTGSVLVHYDPTTASVSTLSEMMLCSAAPARVISNNGKGRQIATRIAAACTRHVMEVTVERVAVALIAAIL